MKTRKILVISDTHKNISNAIDAALKEKPDYILHLGDHADDADELKYIFNNADIFNVCGNCDWASFTNAPVECMIDIEGIKILMCHGHTYNVKGGAGAYLAHAREKSADIALFGHTHKPMLDNLGDIILMNPGTVNTYGIIEINDGKINAYMCDFEV